MQVNDLLQVFEEASGQRVNVSKSLILFSSNVSNEIKKTVCQTLQMTEADENYKYLGLPNLVGRNKSSVLGFLKEKVRNKWNLGNKVGYLR